MEFSISLPGYTTFDFKNIKYSDTKGTYNDQWDKQYLQEIMPGE